MSAMKGKVRIIFKSGATLDLEVDDFTATRRAGSLVELNYRGAKPRVLYISLEEVAAIIEL